MTTDFRALCIELADAYLRTLEHINNSTWLGYEPSDDLLLQRTRAALADEPAVPEGKKPTRDELWELWLRLNNELPDRPAAVAEFWEHAQIDARARAALADQQQKSPTKHELFKLLLQSGGATRCVSIEWIEPFANAVLASWGRQPAPPADGEVAELVAEIRHFLAGYQQMRGLDPEHIYSIHRGDKMEAHITVSRLTRAAELLQRQVPVPVSVSERLPGPEDCDAEGRCWFGTPGCNVWGASWVLRKRSHQRNGITSWLPAHALPLPEVGED